MARTLLDAKARLEQEGLHVACNNAHSLWIAGTVEEMGDGIKLSHDACPLRSCADRWVAIFPADGLLTYEVPGSLTEPVSLISNVYRLYREQGGELKDAVKRSMSNAEQYLVGHSVARV